MITMNVRTCFTSDSLATATQRMWDHDCGYVPLLNEQARVVGMVTDRDICMAAFSQRAPISEIKASTVMSRQLFHSRGASSHLPTSARLMSCASALATRPPSTRLNTRRKTSR